MKSIGYEVLAWQLSLVYHKRNTFVLPNNTEMQPMLPLHISVSKKKVAICGSSIVIYEA